jgi:hypothetical protein
VLEARLPARLTPLAHGLGLRPFYGDIHNHCALSYGHGRLEDALQRARNQLDFVSVTGHAHWPDMPVEDPSVAHIVAFHVKGFAKLRSAWPEHFETLRRFHEEGRFTVFPGYEIHSCEHGDYTIIYRDLAPRDLVLADSPAELRHRLDGRYPGAALAFPHHIGYRLGARGINWASLDPALSPVLEMISMHGSSETSLTDRPFLHSMGPSDGRSTVQHGLSLGHVFGLIGNTDHHSGYPGSYGHGRTCVYAAENTAQALWQALWSRRTNALTGDRTHLFTAMGDRPQGSIVPPGADRLEIEAVGGSFIETIDVMRNGRLLERISPALRPSPITAVAGELETMLVVELGWGARGSSHLWTGWIEVDDGEILSVEPRLRGGEIVSPLEGDEEPAAPDHVAVEGNRVDFEIRAHANPNNMTPATQAIALRCRLSPRARIRAELGGRRIAVTGTRLREGALSGNIGPIDSPAYRLHPLPAPHEWQWRGSIPLAPLGDGDSLYVRMRQANQQWSWASPLFCRR